MSELGDELSRLLRAEARLRHKTEQLEGEKAELRTARLNRERLLADLAMVDDLAHRAHVPFARQKIQELLNQEMEAAWSNELALDNALTASRERLVANWRAQEDVEQEILAEFALEEGT